MPVGAVSCFAHATCAISLTALAVLSAHADVTRLRQTVCEAVVVGQATLSEHPHGIAAARVDTAQTICRKNLPIARLWGWFWHMD